MKTRKHLYDTAKQSNLDADWNAYRSMKNLVHNKLKKVHNIYFGRLFDNTFSGNRRQFWKYIRVRCKDSHEISYIASYL